MDQEGDGGLEVNHGSNWEFEFEHPYFGELCVKTEEREDLDSSLTSVASTGTLTTSNRGPNSANITRGLGPRLLWGM